MAVLCFGIRSRPALAVYSVFDGDDLYCFGAESKEDAAEQMASLFGYTCDTALEIDCQCSLEIHRHDEELKAYDASGKVYLRPVERGLLSTTAY